jgi:hypothetical protein
LQRLSLVVALGLSVLALMTTTLVDSVAAQVAPRGGVVEVTGYRKVTDYEGSVGPVSVVVTGKKAAAIRSALTGLSAASPPSECFENPNAFKITFLTRQGGRHTYVATEGDCPTPGIVSITVDGKTTENLVEDCALRAAVLASLPKGRAEGTRRDKSHCSI